MRLRVASAVVLAVSFALPTCAQSPGTPLDQALTAFFEADSPERRTKATKAILALDTDFETLRGKLRAGRIYAPNVPTGRLEESRKGRDGLWHRYVVLVPDDYDRDKAYSVCFYLHGGVNRTEPWGKGGDWWRRFDRFDNAEQISVFPASWTGAPWWQRNQIENLEAILDRVKRIYHVDENRVYLFGVSDGAAGVYYHAFKAPTIWAAFFVFIGHPAVLANPATGVDAEMFVSNLANKPFYVVSGEKDRLYPSTRVAPFVDEFRKAGTEVDFRVVPGGHNTRWWNQEAEAIDDFMTSHPREPLPDELTWETERADRFGRLHWLLIEALAAESGRSHPPRSFPHSGRSGRISLARSGNRIEVDSVGVARYRLLLSPEQFDFVKPIQVVENGVVRFDSRVEPSKDVLLRWAAIDNDRTMLFGAELTFGGDIEVSERAPR